MHLLNADCKFVQYTESFLIKILQQSSQTLPCSTFVLKRTKNLEYRTHPNIYFYLKKLCV